MAEHYLLKALRNNPHMGVEPWNGITRPARNRGYSTKVNGTGLKPLAIVAPTIRPPCPAPVDNRHERRRQSKLGRGDRGKLARTIELFERRTRGTGKDGRRTQGALKASGVEIGKEMLFEWLNMKTGALFPSHATIAEATGWSVSTVKRALKALAVAGVLHWFRRPTRVDGILRYKSNAYALAQRATETPVNKDKDRTWGVTASLPSLVLILRDVASQVGCKFLM